MKVRIQYATEMSGLVSKISELVEQNVAPIEQAAALLKSISCVLEIEGNNSVEYSHDAIDRVRKSLSEVDEVLADINGLMGSYIKSVLKAEVPPRSPSPNAYDYKAQHTVPPQEPVDDPEGE